MHAARAIALARYGLAPSTLGAPTHAFDWIAIAPADDSFKFYGNQAYALHAFLKDNLSIDWAKEKLSGRGWKVGYTWQQGQPSRGLYPIDDSLAHLPASPAGFIRVYGEADAPPAGDNAPTSFALPWPGQDYYQINQVWQLQPATTTNPCAPTVAACAPPAPQTATTRGAVLIASAAGVALGIALDAATRWVLRW